MERSKEEIHDGVQAFYTKLVREVQGGRSCCGPARGVGPAPAERSGYSEEDLQGIPQEAAGASFGCGNPTAFAEVAPGQTVLDLGSGAGIDCFVAADKVGPSGRVIGVDMTEEMLRRATDSATRNGYTNVEFRRGHVEALPVADESVDWVISNCVINLSPDKERVFAEAHRVLRPGGRILISDIVAENLPEDVRADMAAWAGCVAGAVSERAYLEMIRDAGFREVEIVDRVDHEEETGDPPARVSSIRVRAVKEISSKTGQGTTDQTGTGLDNETRLLVATGAAVAAGCVPCLQTIVDKARAEGVSERKLKEAAITGQYVKEQPNRTIRAFADELLGTHLNARDAAADTPCPLTGSSPAGAGEKVAPREPASSGCGCS